jgi:hypothetical protein
LNLEYCSLCKVEVTDWRAHCRLPEHQRLSMAHIGQRSCTVDTCNKEREARMLSWLNIEAKS